MAYTLVSLGIQDSVFRRNSQYDGFSDEAMLPPFPYKKTNQENRACLFVCDKINFHSTLACRAPITFSILICLVTSEMKTEDITSQIFVESYHDATGLEIEYS
jgi:hypothetical protein